MSNAEFSITKIGTWELGVGNWRLDISVLRALRVLRGSSVFLLAGSGEQEHDTGLFGCSRSPNFRGRYPASSERLAVRIHRKQGPEAERLHIRPHARSVAHDDQESFPGVEVSRGGLAELSERHRLHAVGVSGQL